MLASDCHPEMMQRRRCRGERERESERAIECIYSNNPTDVVIFTKSKHISNGMQFQNNIHFMIISTSEERMSGSGVVEDVCSARDDKSHSLFGCVCACAFTIFPGFIP